MITEKNVTALIDLDGTLADLDEAVISKLMEMASPIELEDYAKNGLPNREVPYIRARRNLIMRQPGFWSSLGIIPDGLTVLNAIREIGFKPMILSKGPSTKYLAWAEKIQWVRENFPGIPVTLTEDKSLSYGKIMFDDYKPYFQPWLDVRPRGLVICLATPDNEDIEPKYKDRVFRYHGQQDYEELYLRLKEAYER